MAEPAKNTAGDSAPPPIRIASSGDSQAGTPAETSTESKVDPQVAKAQREAAEARKKQLAEDMVNTQGAIKEASKYYNAGSKSIQDAKNLLKEQKRTPALAKQEEAKVRYKEATKILSKQQAAASRLLMGNNSAGRNAAIDFYKLQGRALSKVGKYEHAINTFQEILQYGGKSLDITTREDLMLRQVEWHIQAWSPKQTKFEKAAERDPDTPRGRNIPDYAHLEEALKIAKSLAKSSKRGVKGAAKARADVYSKYIDIFANHIARDNRATVVQVIETEGAKKEEARDGYLLSAAAELADHMKDVGAELAELANTDEEKQEAEIFLLYGFSMLWALKEELKKIDKANDKINLAGRIVLIGQEINEEWVEEQRKRTALLEKIYKERIVPKIQEKTGLYNREKRAEKRKQQDEARKAKQAAGGSGEFNISPEEIEKELSKTNGKAAKSNGLTKEAAESFTGKTEETDNNAADTDSELFVDPIEFDEEPARGTTTAVAKTDGGGSTDLSP